MQPLCAIFFFLPCLLIAPAIAADSVASDPRATIRTIEPERDVGYSVGDKITRTVILEVERPYELLPTSLPVPGTQKKRRDQELGIETHAVLVAKTTRGNKHVYTLRLTYQVFTRGVTAKPTALPAEFVQFGSQGENFTVRIPSWHFRISPLAVFGNVVVEKDMSGLRGPLLLDAGPALRLLWMFLGICVLSLLGLLYILGSRCWLPRMGGPFARAGRDLKKLPTTDAGLKQAITRLHQAFNMTAGLSVFNAAGFLRNRPNFALLQEDIERFFDLSRAVFFDTGAAHGIDNPHVWLCQFCRRCRDCERGLT